MWEVQYEGSSHQSWSRIAWDEAGIQLIPQTTTGQSLRTSPDCHPQQDCQTWICFNVALPFCFHYYVHYIILDGFFGAALCLPERRDGAAIGGLGGGQEKWGTCVLSGAWLSSVAGWLNPAAVLCVPLSDIISCTWPAMEVYKVFLGLVFWICFFGGMLQVDHLSFPSFVFRRICLPFCALSNGSPAALDRNFVVAVGRERSWLAGEHG